VQHLVHQLFQSTELCSTWDTCVGGQLAKLIRNGPRRCSVLFCRWNHGPRVKDAETFWSLKLHDDVRVCRACLRMNLVVGAHVYVVRLEPRRVGILKTACGRAEIGQHGGSLAAPPAEEGLVTGCRCGPGSCQNPEGWRSS
jgi:hypothetical protein